MERIDLRTGAIAKTTQLLGMAALVRRPGRSKAPKIAGPMVRSTCTVRDPRLSMRAQRLENVA